MNVIEFLPRRRFIRFPAGRAYLWHDPGGLTLIDLDLPGSGPRSPTRSARADDSLPACGGWCWDVSALRRTWAAQTGWNTAHGHQMPSRASPTQGNAGGSRMAPRGNRLCSQDVVVSQLMMVPVLGTTRSRHGE